MIPIVKQHIWPELLLCCASCQSVDASNVLLWVPTSKLPKSINDPTVGVLTAPVSVWVGSIFAKSFVLGRLQADIVIASDCSHTLQRALLNACRRRMF